MTKKQFKIWLIQHDYTLDSLAAELSITRRTIDNYQASERFPRVFELALKALEAKSFRLDNKE